MNHYKYGWSKPANNTLNLTLIHSPTSTTSDYQGDIFPITISGINLAAHSFSYGIYSYSGNWRNGVENQTQQFNLPLVGYQTGAHATTLALLPNSGKTYSFVSVSDPTKIQIMAVKKAERGDTTGGNKYIVRVREIAGGAAATTGLIFGNQVTAALSTNGMEDETGATTLTPTGADLNQISFSIGKYQIRTLKVALGGLINPTRTINPEGKLRSYDDMVFKVTVVAGGRQNMVKFLLNPAEKVRKVYIVNLAGSLVRTLYDGSEAFNSSASIAWNGRTNGNGVATNGVYVVNIVTDRVQRHAVLQLMR
jgi:hypothetical protein